MTLAPGMIEQRRRWAPCLASEGALPSLEGFSGEAFTGSFAPKMKEKRR
eukprot:CAMPEP_0170645386 /NCGR_PEP_ID=MMETSP0224-20130122/43052_1 /TAXON_ID=285029 /ORGANISM="Togula jolla, Strain CCCM 725" /LENGTH=48 /DNA_ID= /DNA_START= /DNA_END= /DNA_ORIENTATION=